MEKTEGSLFDGIGGFPLAASRHGIKTLWASEIEPFPIRVTKERFPDMKHLGDIAKINGAEIDPVDIVTFGSPCQDLSVAGKRAGLAGERSGLFMEAIRIIKEMRGTYAGSSKPVRPRFTVWENVPGAFSSNKGEDFRAVLEEICRVKDNSVSIPQPPGAKWNRAGCIMGDGFSVAWRIIDAQFWGVPQRRRRIFLVADFGGQSAPEILFKRKGLSRHSQESGEARKGTAADAEGSVTYAIQHSIIGRKPEAGAQGKGWRDDNKSFTLDSRQDVDAICNAKYLYESHPGDSRVTGPVDVCPTAASRWGAGGNNTPLVQTIDCTPNGISGTVSSKWAKGTGGPAGDEHYNLICYEQKDIGRRPAEFHDQSPTLRSRMECSNIVPMISQRYSVRRLTPLECERLQGYPDGWTDIPGASDSGRYKALGNSVAIPCVEYVMEGISEILSTEEGERHGTT